MVRARWSVKQDRCSDLTMESARSGSTKYLILKQHLRIREEQGELLLGAEVDLQVAGMCKGRLQHLALFTPRSLLVNLLRQSLIHRQS